MNLGRRELIRYAASATLLAGLAPLSASAANWRGYSKAILIDGLGSPGKPEDEGGWGSPLSPTAIEDVRNSGMTAMHITVGSVGEMTPLQAFHDIVTSVTGWDKLIDLHPAVFAGVQTADDIRRAKKDSKLALLYGLQDGVSFQDDPERLQVLQQLGIHIVQPTYNRRNLLGDGCMEPANAGLSRTGRDSIERMNELGLLVDLSHCGRQTAADAIAVSRRPVAFTHTGCDALQKHPRHRTDAEIRQVAESGGVTGIYIMPYLTGAQPTAANVVAHIEHALDVAGEDHVSIGTDGYLSPTTLTDEYKANFAASNRRRREAGIAAPGETETGYLFADDLNTPDRFATLADLLLERGHSERTVEKVLGANLMRVFDEVWT